MSQCTDVDAALRRLEQKIDKQIQCCEANKKEIASIKRRLDRLEGNSSKELKITKVCRISISALQGLRVIA
jgi:hypothetical protein